MKLSKLIFLLLLLSEWSFGQTKKVPARHQMEFSAGMNLNRFYDFDPSNNDFVGRYHSNYGYAFTISMEDVVVADMPYRFSLQLDHYEGSAYVFNGGRAGGSKNDADVFKTVAKLGIYPFNYTIFQKLRLGLGAELGCLIFQKAKGSISYSVGGSPGHHQSLSEDSSDLNHKFSFGIGSRIGYYFTLKKGVYIVPQYLYYLGLTDEFKDFDAKIKSMRHYVAVGIVWTPEKDK